MKYVKIENGVVVQVQPNDESGFVEAPDSVIAGMKTPDNGATFNLPPTPPRNPKEIRDADLSSLVHDLGDGRVIQCRPLPLYADEILMRNAIEWMERHGLNEHDWIMADNTVRSVTIDDLEAAIASGQDQAAPVWETLIDILKNA